jgi:hypothetical protein
VTEAPSLIEFEDDPAQNPFEAILSSPQLSTSTSDAEQTATKTQFVEPKTMEDCKALLLKWVNKQVQPLGVSVLDFGEAWRDGISFCALVASLAPDALNFNAVQAKSPNERLAIAFSVAQSSMNIFPLLDVEDLSASKIDERSLM